MTLSFSSRMEIHKRSECTAESGRVSSRVADSGREVMGSKLILILILVISVTGSADYVRPKPRKNLHFPWKPKALSHPQQVT